MVQVISTTAARKSIGRLVERVREKGGSIAIGRRGTPEVLLIRYPRYNSALSDVTNIAANAGAFDFLEKEPDLYSDDDVRVRYA